MIKRPRGRKLIRITATIVVVVASLLFFYTLVGSIKPQADTPLPANISKKVFTSRQVGFNQNETPVDGITIDGSGQLDSGDDLIRVIFQDSSGKDYLVLEQNGIYSPSKTFNFQNFGEETTYLSKVSPTLLRIEKTAGAKITISKINLIRLSSGQSTVQKIINTIGINIEANTNTTVASLGAQQKKLRDSLESEKIKNLNVYLEKNGKKWRAKETQISSATFAEKEKLFGSPLPNLAGLEYYASGVFDFGVGQSIDKASSSSFPSSFDWRNRNGQSYVTPVKEQGTGCYSCWAFTSITELESALSLKSNKIQNLDLSEQWGICTTSNGCDGGSDEIYDYLAKSNIGNNIPIDSVLPYASKDNRNGICPNPLTNSDNGVKISDFRYYYKGALSDGSQTSNFGYFDKSGYHPEQLTLSETWIKEKLIKYGPLYAGLDYSLFDSSAQTYYGHAVLLVGWNTDSQGKTVWIAKNSWGTSWGQQGYLNSYISDLNSSIKAVGYLIDPYFTKADNTVNCVDNDKDGYYSWGISPTKPSSCPSNIPAQEDCDDSSAALGPFDSSYNCVKLAGAAAPTPTQTSTASSSASVTAQAIASVAISPIATATSTISNPAVPAVPAKPTATATTTPTITATISAANFATDSSTKIYSVLSSTPKKYDSPYSNQNEFIVSGVKSGPSFFIILAVAIISSSAVLFYLRDKKN